MPDVELPTIRSGTLNQRPHGEATGDGLARPPRQPVDERGQQVRLDGKRAIGRLDPIGASGAADFVRELALILRA